MQDGRLAAEVHVQRQAAALVDPGAQVAKYLGGRAAETVNRLLEVADEEQPASVEARAAERFHKIDLQLVGVLKLVDEQEVQVLGKALTNCCMLGIAYQCVGPRKQVVEIEPAEGGF